MFPILYKFYLKTLITFFFLSTLDKMYRSTDTQYVQNTHIIILNIIQMFKL